MKRVKQKDENFYTLDKGIPEIDLVVKNETTWGIVHMLERIGEKLQLEEPKTFAFEIMQDNQDLIDINEDLKRVLYNSIKNYPIEE